MLAARAAELRCGSGMIRPCSCPAIDKLAASSRMTKASQSVTYPSSGRSAELNPIVGDELMDIPDRNGRRLGWRSRIVRGWNRGRLQEALETGRPEHEQIVILADPGIAQLVGDAARREVGVAST